MLYIVRVPGSRDIFLTPLKPPTKASISAEAIQSSLYYFHISTAEEEAVRASLEQHNHAWSTERNSQTAVIPRKPLSSSLFAEGSDREHLQALPKRYSLSSNPQTESEGFAECGRYVENARRVPSRSLDETSTIARKPLAPRLESGRKAEPSRAIDRKPVGGFGVDGNTRQNTRQSTWTQLPPQGGSSNFLRDAWLKDSPGDVATNYCHSSITNAAPAHPQSTPPFPPQSSRAQTEEVIDGDFRVIIIRRDPTSGSQWNIGSLSRAQRPDSMDGESLRIEITTPGYQRFARQTGLRAPVHEALPGAVAAHKLDSTSGNLSTSPENYGPTLKTTTPSSTPVGPMQFTRDLMLNRQAPSHRPKNSHNRRRSNSTDSFPFFSSSTTEHGSPNAQAQLTFSSPWQGTCTFATGMDGRTLKCRHKLPSSNPDQVDNSALVAELRFSLPWSALRSRDGNVSAPAGGKRPNTLTLLGEDAKLTLKKGMARIRKELHSPSSAPDLHTGVTSMAAKRTSISLSPADDDDSDSSIASDRRLDLTLGRERAGGGRKGKNAKLGKLVLKDEGLKMADLTVAACMGVWWGVYWRKVGTSGL